MKQKIIAALLISASPVYPVAAEHGETTPAAFDEQISETKSYIMSDPASALASARDAAKIAHGLPDSDRPMALATSQWLEGEALTRLNKAQQAEPVINGALKSVRQVAPGSKLNGDLLKSSAAIASQNGKVEQALASLHQAYRIYDKLDDKRSQAIALHLIGSIYYEARDYDRVLKYYDDARNIYPEDVALTLSSHNNRGNALRDMGKFAEAEAEFDLALEAAKQMDSPMLEVRVMTNIASAQYLQGRYDAADRTARSALEKAGNGASEWSPYIWGVRAQTALASGRLDQASNYIRRTFRGVDLENSTTAFRDYHQTAAQVYRQLGQYELAFDHLAAFKRLDDSGRDLAASTNAALTAAQFDDANRELRISRLEAQEAQRAMELARSQTTLNFAYILLGFAVTVIGILFYSIRNIRRKRREISRANEKLSYAAKHDLMTGLANRGHFRALLADALEEADGKDRQCAVMLIDLDRFKAVNDTLGHDIGDKLLCHVADRLRKVGGDYAHPVRLGGDEFALVVPDIKHREKLLALGERVIGLLGGTHIVDGTSVSIGATVGLAIGPDDNHTVEGLTRCADLALYQGKNSGRGCCISYKPVMQEEADERIILEQDLSEAIEKGELSIVYQSIINAESEEVIGYEALLRWNHPTRGEISPAVFIPIAEEARLIGAIGSWVLRTACEEAQNWPENVKLAVNVSALQVKGGGLANIIVSALASSGLRPDRLELEVTESVFLDKENKADSILEGLRSLGVSLALDDFGTGYSSLGYLRRAAFSTIKIDRSFVKAATSGSTDSVAIIRAILSMADELGMETTAEGIESAHELELMRKLGCTQLQGYLFSRPGEAASGDAVDSRIIPFASERKKRQAG